jgi:hypothetical protein
MDEFLILLREDLLMKTLILLGLFVGQIMTGNYRRVSSLPNFGNTTIGASGFNTVGTFLAGSYFTAAHSGTYVTFHIYCQSAVGTSYFGVYPAPGGNASGQTLIAQGTYNCASTWATGAISVPVVAGNTYFFAAQTSASTFGIAWDSTTGSAAFALGVGGTMPTTAPALTSQTGNYSMYLSQP